MSNPEYKEVFKELLASQTIFIPFDLRIIRLVCIFMDHEASMNSSRQRVPRTFPKPLPMMKKFESLVPAWHTQFLKMKVMNNESTKLGDLQEVLSCASFMGVRSLVRLVSAKIASLMQSCCHDIEQVRSLFGIKNDYNPAIL